MTASILSNRRPHGAFDMAGGAAGQLGINRLMRGEVRVEELAHIGQAQMHSGDVFEIHIPGGWGIWGSRSHSQSAKEAASPHQ